MMTAECPAWPTYTSLGLGLSENLVGPAISLMGIFGSDVGKKSSSVLYQNPILN